jgi:glucose-6-phosphate 1-dehydrogenase
MNAADDPTAKADALVIFGISGDLARKMTFKSLYLLERRGLLDHPIIGVATRPWSDDDLRAHARAAIEGSGVPFDEETFARFAARLTYLSGDFTADETYDALLAALGGAQRPLFYLEIPPFLFGTVVKGLARVGLTEHARVAIEKPFGHDLASARALNAELHALIREDQLRPASRARRWPPRRRRSRWRTSRAAGRSGGPPGSRPWSAAFPAAADPSVAIGSSPRPG